MDENKLNSHQRCYHLGGHIPNNDSSVSNIRTAFFLNILDPILSLFISAYVFRGVIKNFRATLLLFYLGNRI